MTNRGPCLLEGQGLRVSPLYLTSFFFPPSSTVCLRVSGAFTCRQGEICQTRTKALAWKGRNTYEKAKKNVPSRVEGRYPKQVFSSTCCLLKSRPLYRVSGVQTVDDVDARDDTGQRASRSERIGMRARWLC